MSNKHLNILEKILQAAGTLQAQGRRSLAVFDLDSTLFDITFRVLHIINDFAKDPKNIARYPQECALLPKLQILRNEWGMNEGLARLGLERARNPEFFTDLETHWSYHFFSDQYLHRDLPLDGAVEYVQELEKLGADILYLTGRDVDRMKVGTTASLKAWKFPLDDKHFRLALKPKAEMDDAQFKLDVLRDLSKQYDRIWLFENEPVNLHLVQKHCPEIELIFIETTHSGREQPREDLKRIRHFEVDWQSFRKFK